MQLSTSRRLTIPLLMVAALLIQGCSTYGKPSSTPIGAGTSGKASTTPKIVGAGERTSDETGSHPRHEKNP